MCHLSIRNILWSCCCGLAACSSNPAKSDDPGEFNGQFQFTTVVAGLDTPWDIAWGPDNAIWITERRGVISRYNPADSTHRQVGQVNSYEQGESGLMGLAFHPDFPQQPMMFLAYSYQSGGGIRNRLVRMSYNGATLSETDILIDDMPGASIHDGARLVVGPDRLLYMTMGDASQSDLAQNQSSSAGKVLRLTLDGLPAPGNPFGTFVYSFGHRNPQGIAVHPVTGIVYVTEHGPSDNDEINRLEAGRNYGWPPVHGFCDGDVQNETAMCQTLNVVEPLAAWTPTIAPSGADFYNSDYIPGWRGSLLFTSLKNQTLYRLTLSGDGTRVVDQETLFAGTFGRLRDVMVGPAGELYLATSNRDGRGSPGPADDRIIRIDPVLE